MSELVLVLLCSSLTFLATILGSATVYFFKNLDNNFEKVCFGLASGIMIAASIFSLLLPAMEQANYWVSICGILIGSLIIYMCNLVNQKIKKDNKSLFFFAVTLHNIPEGMIVGLACSLALSGNTVTSALALSLGIAIQNIPEGAAVSLPMLKTKKNKHRAFLSGFISAIVEPISAIMMFFLAHYLSQLMPFFLSLAAGTMFYVVVDELIPESKKNNSDTGVISFMFGFLIMMLLDVSLG